MATQIAYHMSYPGFDKNEAMPLFTPRTAISRPLSQATTDILDSDHDDEDDDFDYPEDSPFTSVASFGTGSVSTASTPNEATTPDSTGLTAFDFHIDEKTVKGPSGPHLFQTPSEASEYNYATDIELPEDRPPSTLTPFYQSASKLDPERRDTPVPNRVPSTQQPQSQPPSQPQSQRTSLREEPLRETDARKWTPRDVVRWLQTNDFDSGIVQTFFENDISGSILLELQTQDLKELGIQSFGKRHMLMGAIQRLRDNPVVARPRARTTSSSTSFREVPPTPCSGSTMSSGHSSSSATDEDRSGRRSARRRRSPKSGEHPRKITNLEPGDSVSIVAIEQILPRFHSCSKGENCRKWQKQQAKLAQLARDLPNGPVNGRLILRGDPGNPNTAPNLVKTPKSDITPSLVASSDVMGPAPSPGLMLSKEKLNEVEPRDPQENVRHFLSFQHLSKLKPVNEPVTPPKDNIPSPESFGSSESAKGNPTLTENLRHLPKLQIPCANDQGLMPNWSAQQKTVTPSMGRTRHYFEEEELTAIPRGQQYAYGVDASPGDFYRTDPHYGQQTPMSEMDVPMTAFPIGPVSRDESQSVPPNMRFGMDRLPMADPIFRPASTKVENHRRNTSQQSSLQALDERRAVHPIETPEDLEKAERRYNPSSPTRRSPNDVTHSGWMKKRKTTRLLRHEWEDHHFTLQGTQLAMHNDEESARRNSKALEHIDVDDYAVACSSLASSSKLTAAFKKKMLKRKEQALQDSAFGFSLIPAASNCGSIVDKKALFLNSGKSHHFAVKTRDERIDWMRELMLAKALKRGKDSGASVNYSGNLI